MKNTTIIISGNFSANGNFTAYGSEGEKLFCHGKMLAALGHSATNLPKFPLFCLWEKKPIHQKNSDGTFSTVEVLRDTIVAIFPEKEEMIKTIADVKTLQYEVRAEITKRVAALGLTDETVATFENAAF